MGIAAGISKGCGKGGKPAYGFPCFPYPGISAACFWRNCFLDSHLCAKPVVRERNPNSPKKPSMFCQLTELKMKGIAGSESGTHFRKFTGSTSITEISVRFLTQRAGRFSSVETILNIPSLPSL